MKAISVKVIILILLILIICKRASKKQKVWKYAKRRIIRRICPVDDEIVKYKGELYYVNYKKREVIPYEKHLRQQEKNNKKFLKKYRRYSQ